MTDVNTDPAHALQDDTKDIGWLLKVIAIGLGGFTLWSAGPGLATDHIRLSVFLLAIWTFVFLSHDVRRQFHKPNFSPLALALGLLSAVSLALLSTMATALFAGEPIAIALAVCCAVLFIATFFVKEASSIALAATGALVIWYTYFNYLELVNRAGAWTDTDVFVAGIATVISLEAARRALGWAIPVIAILAMGYAYFGRYMPYDIAHRGVGPERILN